jgi:hypothetical protein
MQSNSNPTDSHLNFGVGCFHFGYSPKAGGQGSGETYVKELNRVLSGISNIENVHISADDTFHILSTSDTSPYLTSGGKTFPPSGHGLEINFTLYIPKRFQADHLRSIVDLDDISERFQVFIDYGFSHPVTFVRSISNDPDTSGSGGVHICSKFLKDYFEKNKFNSEIVFEVLGPSPFHAEFKLNEVSLDEFSQSGTSGFMCSLVDGHGYADIEFRYPKEAFDSATMAFEHLRYRLHEQFEYFYEFQRWQKLRMESWDELSDNLQALTSELLRTGVSSRLQEYFRSSHKVDSAIIHLANFESAEIHFQHQMQTARQRLRIQDQTPEIEPFIAKQERESIVFPTNQTRQTLELLRARRTHTSTNLIVLIAAILGGAFGALITTVTQSTLATRPTDKPLEQLPHSEVKSETVDSPAIR